MTVVTVEIEDDIMERVQRYSDKKQMSFGDILATSLRKFLLLAELTELQNQLEGEAKKLGFDGEDELLNAIS